jgi:type I restriction enzyme, S subunit
MKWPPARIGTLVKIRGGGTPKRDHEAYFCGDIPWVTPKDMKTWEIADSQIKITREALENSATTLVPPNTVLLVVRSGILKHSAPIAINRRAVAINQDMKSLQCDPSLCPEFLARFLQFSEPIILNWVRATTADNYSIDKIKELEIPLPPLAEQRRIAAILDQADELRRKRRHALERLNTLSEGIFAEACGSIAPMVSIGSALDERIILLHKDGNHGSLYPRAEDFGNEGVPFCLCKKHFRRGVYRGAAHRKTFRN